MELENTNVENSFDPTPKLKSSPIPILFVPFVICVFIAKMNTLKLFVLIKNIAKNVYHDTLLIQVTTIHTWICVYIQ